MTALDTDGQDSLFLDGANPPAYSYEAAEAPSLTLSPTALAAGAESMIEITGVNTGFAEGRTQVGFGLSDVVVRRVWALGPDRLLANVYVSPNAKTGLLPLTVVTDFQTVTKDLALDVQAPRLDTPVVNPVALNPDTGQPSIYAGGKAALSVAQMPAGLTASAVTITVDDLPAAVLAMAEGRITFAVPLALKVGPAVLRLSAAGLAAAPVVVAIDAAPPVIQSVASPAVIGQSLWVTVTGLNDPAVLADPSRLVLTLGGVTHTPVTLRPSETLPDGYDARIEVSSEVQPGEAVPLTAAVGYRISQPVMVPVQAAN